MLGVTGGFATAEMHSLFCFFSFLGNFLSQAFLYYFGHRCNVIGACELLRKCADYYGTVHTHEREKKGKSNKKEKTITSRTYDRVIILYE